MIESRPLSRERPRWVVGCLLIRRDCGPDRRNAHVALQMSDIHNIACISELTGIRLHLHLVFSAQARKEA